MKIHLRNACALLVAGALALVTGISLHPTPAFAQGNWQPYLELLKKDKSQGVKFAAIYGLDGAKWTANAEAKPGEIPTIVAGMKDNSKFQASGIVFSGIKYMYLTTRSPEGVVGRKGANSIVIRTTAKAVLIIITSDGANPANITSIDFVADDLKKKKF
jgi:hypothetical protein